VILEESVVKKLMGKKVFTRLWHYEFSIVYVLGEFSSAVTCLNSALQLHVCEITIDNFCVEMKFSLQAHILTHKYCILKGNTIM
jgi:hypothetical protein